MKEIKSIGAITLGCKMNQYETDKMLKAFAESGYEVRDFQDECSVYLINTCTVTGMADKKSRQLISKARKRSKDALVVAAGCYVDVSEDKLKQNAKIDLLVKNNDKDKIVEIVEDEIGRLEVACESEYKGDSHKRALLKIQTGCNMFCSYCIIPYARGRSVSMATEDVLAEARMLADNGHKELVVTGIHIASFRNGDYRLIDLLEDLNKIEGIERIRLGSLEPTIVNEDFAKRIGSLEKICPHFHLSLQSGSDVVLKRMGRRYEVADFTKAVRLLREVFEKPSITTDIIVGFNGETEECFKETLEFVKNISFFDIHVFKYSKREGTKAEAFSDDVDGNIKNKRSEILIELKDKINKESVGAFIGKEEEVLIEEEVRFGGNYYYTGYTTRYLKVYIKMDEGIAVNEIVKVKIVSELKDGVLGERIK